MFVYLVQHGRAKPKEEDPDRPLTDEGRREMEAVMLLLMRYGAVRAARVVHSGKLRAEETAQMIATKLEAEIEQADGLDPEADPADWAARLRDSDRDLIVVGHLPHLERLTGLLLCGAPDARTVRFANGGVVCLALEEGRWSLHWAIPPSLVQE